MVKTRCTATLPTIAVENTSIVATGSQSLGGMAYQHSLSNWKYLSRDIPDVRRLFLMMKTGTAWYLGMTTGRRTRGFVKTMWSPSSRTHRKPSCSKMH
jgi:hypothetical protein